MKSSVLARALAFQPRVLAFFERSLAQKKLSHALLLSGGTAEARRAAARGLAQSLVCKAGGCGNCDECVRAAHGTHPDISWLAPGSSAQGYLVEQVREIIQDAALSPVRAAYKIYVITNAGQLGTQAANALLKTLEEPTNDVVFILEAPTAEAVLATVRSRCTLVPFAPQDPIQEAELLAQTTHCSLELARVALVVSGSAGNALDYVQRPENVALRELALTTLTNLKQSGDGALMSAASAMAAQAQAAAQERSARDDASAEQDAEYLSKSARKEIEQRQKRRAQAEQRSMLLEVVRVIQTALQDGLSAAMNALETPLNTDFSTLVAELSHKRPEVLLQALELSREAERNLMRGLTPELVLQVFFLRLKEALCPLSVQ